MKLKSRLPVFLLTGMALLLSFFASSCYYSWSMSGEGYEGGHVYLVKVPGRCVDYDYFESQDPLDYLKKTDLLYAYDQDFSGYEVSSERYQASLETYEELNSQGYSIGGDAFPVEYGHGDEDLCRCLKRSFGRKGNRGEWSGHAFSLPRRH